MKVTDSLPFVGDATADSGASGTLKGFDPATSNGTTGVDLVAAETGVTFAPVLLVIYNSAATARQVILLDGTTALKPYIQLPAAIGTLVLNHTDLAGIYKTTAGAKLAYKLDGGTNAVTVGGTVRRV